MLQASARAIALSLTILFSKVLFAQPSNDNFACTGLPALTPASSCTTVTGDLYQSNTSSTTSTCGTTYDVWYSVTTPLGCTALNIDVSALAAGGNNLTSSNTFVQAFSESGCALVPRGFCTSLGTTLALPGLSPSTIYFIRVFVTTNPSTQSGKWDFDICVTYTPPPSNDDCSAATLLTSATSCANTSGTIANASASTGLPAGCEAGGTHYDVWYKFVANNNTHTITIGSQGANFTNSAIQLYSGSCGSLISVGCGTTSVTSSLLNSGSTYYVRVSNTGTSAATSGGFTICVTNPTPAVTVAAGRMNEVYKQTILSGSGVLSYPWEITYGPDDNLWITESRGYKVYRMDPNTGTKTTVLDLNSTSTDLSAWGADSLRAVNLTSTSNWNTSANAWPQGGLAGLAIHPKFLDGTGLYDFVYLSYVHRYLSTASGSGGIFFRNKIVRFTYNTGTGKLGSPAEVCDTIPGSQDHNSQRMIIAPATVGGPNYLFYASGDMGSGQYSNKFRPMNPQNVNSYEGKILRFNLEPVAGSWIPADNPYSNTSAVFSTGIRNNQGFAYDTATHVLYGSSHGPFSDDEINIIESGKNYGHPLVVGFSNDGNYNGITAGSGPNMGGSTSTAPLITDEVAAASGIGSSYKNPLFSAYTTPTPVAPSNYTTISELWNGTTGGNNIWPSEGWSGLDLYTHTLIPGWKRSLVASGLKWGRLIRLKLGPTGITTLPSNLGYGNTGDTITYFQSTNRYRDLTFAPNGKDVFIIMDNNSATSGPGTGNSIVPACPGCVVKYSFLGYADNAGKSSISNSIDITAGTANTITSGTTVTIDASNNTHWVPITGPDGNILAEIKANGNNLGTVNSTFYIHSGLVREDASKKLYLNRSITITPQNQPSSTVNVRLYITSAELASLMSATNSQGVSSGVSSVSNLKILKNTDATPVALVASAATIIPAYAETFSGTSNGGYVLQADISSFSSFYFGDPGMIPLPLELLSFRGSLKNNAALLNWQTSNENNTSHFLVERSVDGQNFETIGRVTAGGTISNAKYAYTDWDADKQSSSILYYRLKMVDKDAGFKQSHIISMSIRATSPPAIVYPNPINDLLNLRLSVVGTEHIHIQVTDMQGRVMYKKVKLISGTEDININTKSWPSQSYSIKVSDGNNKILLTKKLIKI